MVAEMNEQPVRKPRNVKIDPVAIRRARIEAIRSERSLGEWLEDAIDEKIQREKMKVE